MQCQSCGYALWNLYSGKCPECGAAYDVRQYAFEPGTVAFACPLCKHQHPGAGEDYLPTSAAEMTCAGCSQRIAVATMTVVPLDVNAIARSRRRVPWEEKSRLGFWRGWWRTAMMSVGKPAELADAIRPLKPGEADWGMPFAMVTWAIAFAAQWFAIMGTNLFYVLTSGNGADVAHWIAASLASGVICLLLMAIFVTFALIMQAVGANLIICGGRRDFEITTQCVYYTQGTMIFAAIPYIGIPLIAVCQIIAMINCARMLARAHRISMLRAALASGWFLWLAMLLVMYSLLVG